MTRRTPFLAVAFWLGFGMLAVAETGTVMPLKRLANDDTFSILNHPQWVIVDTRIPDAYNGWPLDHVARGGHLPGAVDFSARWLKCKANDTQQRLTDALRLKGVTRDKRILLVDANGQDHLPVAQFLRKLGLTNLYYFSIGSWAEDERLPLEQYPQFWRLVPPVVVKQLTAGEHPATFETAGSLRFAEVSWGDASKSYDRGHIPGSFHINTDTIEPPPQWLLGDIETLRRFVRKHGLHFEDTMVLSGEEPMAAHRVAIVLNYLGVKDVRVLNGGIAAWVRDGYELDTATHDPPPPREFGIAIPAAPAWIDSMDHVRTCLSNAADFLLVDVRGRDEFSGKITGYAYCNTAGRIPGAVFGFGGVHGVNSLDYYRNVDDTMRNADEIRTMWRQSGIDTRKHISFSCGSGWRAAEVLNYARVMGLTNVSTYSNGWIEWSRHPENPIVTGPVDVPATRRRPAD